MFIGRLTGDATVGALFSLPFWAAEVVVLWWPFSDDTLLASLSDKAPPKMVKTLWGRFWGSRLIFRTPASLPFHHVEGPGPASRPLVAGYMSA